MEQKRETCVADGQIGDSEQQDPNYIGWMGQVAHPDSPAGGGGPGGFSRSWSEESEGISLPLGKTSGALQIVPMETETPKPPNPPPATKPRSLGMLVVESTEFLDVSIEAKLVADGKSASGINTSVGKPASSSPGYETDADGKISKFLGKFKWRGVIDIQTVYGPESTASDVSCYGRGTKKDDVQNRDITLGFHEHQHQLDYINYLQNHSLPALPAMRIGMTPTEYTDETTRFKDELDQYWKDMEADTIANTDEVGHKKSTWESTGTCYLHLMP